MKDNELFCLYSFKILSSAVDVLWKLIIVIAVSF